MKFAKYLPPSKQIQLLENLKREATYPDGLEIRTAIHWLKAMPLTL